MLSLSSHLPGCVPEAFENNGFFQLTQKKNVSPGPFQATQFAREMISPVVPYLLHLTVFGIHQWCGPIHHLPRGLR